MKPVKFFVKAALIICVLSTTTVRSLSAQQTLATTNSATAPIRYMGSQDGLLVFEVNLTLPANKRTDLRILDGFGNAIFEERLTGTTHKKRYKITGENGRRISFQVITGQSTIRQSFDINYKVAETWEVVAGR